MPVINREITTQAPPSQKQTAKIKYVVVEAWSGSSTLQQIYFIDARNELEAEEIAESMKSEPNRPTTFHVLPIGKHGEKYFVE